MGGCNSTSRIGLKGDAIDMGAEWVDGDKQDVPSRDELLQLYGLFQTRQIADLDMLHKYANYYVAALLAMLAALVLGATRGYEMPVAGALVVLPVVSLMLSQQGKLMAFRFYRRYNEGRMRLTKIEYLLGLHGPVVSSRPPPHDLWPEDRGFLLGRYKKEAEKESSSDDFIDRRSRVRFLGGYGAGYIVQMTFSVFSCLFALVIVGLPIALLRTEMSTTCKWTNVIFSLVGLAIVEMYMVWYRRTLKRMQAEGREKGATG